MIFYFDFLLLFFHLTGNGGFYSGWFAAVVQRYLNINVGPQRDFIC